MKKFKKITGCLLAVLMLATAFSGCGDKETQVDPDTGKVKITAAIPGATNEWKNDEIYKSMSDKFGLDVDFISVTLDSLPEKTQIWVSAGNMPDVMFSEFVFKDYVAYGKQGMLKALPDDYKTKYPNLANNLKRTMVLEKLEEVNNGTIYGIPRAMSFGLYPDQKEEGSINIDPYNIAYRKDWAKQLGIEVKPIMEYDEFIALAKAFKEADLGKVGEENVMGFTVSPDNAPFVFVTAHNSNFNVFYKNNGKYVCGYNDASTLEGVKAYKAAYQEGILHPNFYAQKAAEIPGFFHTGKTGLFFQTFGASDYQKFKEKFKSANPELDPDECIGLMWIKGPDGKLRGRESSNYWSSIYFNPKINDVAFDRVLQLIDYGASEEGSKLFAMGFEGKDYTEENGTYTRTLPLNNDGTMKAVKDVYPSTDFFTAITSTSFVSPELLPKNIEEVGNQRLAKLASDLDLKKLDLDMEFYTSDKYNKFKASHDIAAIMAEIVVGDGDTEAEWNSKIADMQASIDAVIKELNENIK